MCIKRLGESLLDVVEGLCTKRPEACGICHLVCLVRDMQVEVQREDKDNA